MNGITLDKISLRYPNAAHDTLKEVDLRLPEGSLTAVVGHSGCGKTSLLNIIAGFVRPSRGKITQNGKAVTRPDDRRVAVFQDDALMPWLNVRQNIALGLKIQNIPQKERQERVRQILEKVHLPHAGDKNIWELSGGMRQRVGIARALAVNPAFLLLDEPFGALDAFTREQMQTLILNLWRQQKTGIFLITHDIEEALLLSTQLVLMTAAPEHRFEIIRTDFAVQYQNGIPIRQIKSSGKFIALREYLFSALAEKTPADLETAA